MSRIFHISLVVNPVAGLGGPSGLKGSDAPETSKIARELGVESAIPQKIAIMLEGLKEFRSLIRFSTVSGAMGEAYFADYDFDVEVAHHVRNDTVALDTQKAVRTLEEGRPDILLFAGGDGTARDVCRGLTSQQVCLGIPSGVKMHSGVFAITPQAALSVVTSMLSRKLVAVRQAEVRDIDERSFKEGRVITKHFGELMVPDDQLLVQSVKCSGLPDDEMALHEISAFIVETLEEDTLYLLGSGGSLKHIKEELGIDQPTLLGVDAWANDALVGRDLNEPDILELIERYDNVRILLSIIGGQGIVLGRGNQQLSARVLERVGAQNLQFIGTQDRLHALQGKPLRVDSGSDELNHALAGYQKILCGYDDFVLYEVVCSA